MPSSNNTPAAMGYRMPAEWEPHEAVWLAWPHDPVTFPDRIPAVEETYVRIIQALHGSEDIHLSVTDERMRARVAERLGEEKVDLRRIHLHIYEHADVWFRDYGPIFVIRPEERNLAMVHWEFNAWGGKYEALIRDTRIPDLIRQDMKIPCFTPGMVLEGGSIDVNGRGTLLTTEQCLLNPNRNPGLTRGEIDRRLMDYLGVRHVIWLKQGIAGDDTDGHIDDIARFVNPTTVVCAYEEDEEDDNFPILQENYERLLAAGDQDGNKLAVIKLPMPGPVSGDEGRLPASYANFYIANRTVLVPTFGHANDVHALDIMQALFPDRKVVGIRCEDLVHGLGALHCITKQQPAVI
ncbi:MAG: agmatine deiminase family protein [bacterium]